MPPVIDPVCGSGSAPLRVRRLGRCSFQDAGALQEAASRAVAAGGVDHLLLLEHPPVITLGRGATAAQVLRTPAELAAIGVQVIETDRGGGATYHGPGQLVGYPIVDLRRRGIGVRAFLGGLEAALVRVVRRLGVDAQVRPGMTGVWTPAGKLAAIGIAVRGGISRHGFALNVETDLSAFAAILPCGLRAPVTSLRRLGCEATAAALSGPVAEEIEAFLQGAGAPVHDSRARWSSVAPRTGGEAVA